MSSWSSSSSPYRVRSALSFVREALEILALRQQVAALKRKRPGPPLNSGDRFFWTALRCLWSRWADVLLIVKPETVVGSYRAGFRSYWRWHSRPRGGRPSITPELRDLIGPLAKENPDWGVPRIHAELQKLGFTIAERTVARYLRPVVRRGDPQQKCLAFLQNHREVNCCIRLLYSSDVDVQNAVLLLCHRARTPQDSAPVTFQGSAVSGS